MEEYKAIITKNLGKSRIWYWKARLEAKLWNLKQSLPKSHKKEFKITDEVGIAPA